MEISVVFRHMAHREDVREYIDKRIRKISRLLREPISIRATITREKYRFIIALRVNSQWFNLNVTESSEEWRSAIDIATSVIENVARKERDRLKKRKKTFNPTKVENTFYRELNYEISNPQKINIKERVLRLKPIPLNEAIEELKKTKDSFYIYIDSTENNIRVLHKKNANRFEMLIPEQA